MKKLGFKGRSLQVRVKRTGNRNDWLKYRELQRDKVGTVKLNFVAGLLNRFFSEFLLSFKIKDFQNTIKKFGNSNLLSKADQKIQQMENKDKPIQVGIKDMREIEKIDGDIVNDIRVAARPSENGRREPIL